MEVSEVWAPHLSVNEVKQEGNLLEKNIPASIDDKKSKLVCDLYYLKSKDVFVTVLNDFITDDFFHQPWQVVTDRERINQFRKKYLNQEVLESKDNFSSFQENLIATQYTSEFNLNELKKVKETGILLETLKNLDEIYYFDNLDTFVYVPHNSTTCYRYESIEIRKKHNIPYQDERLQKMYW
jgi:hypothetical protein